MQVLIEIYAKKGSYPVTDVLVEVAGRRSVVNILCCRAMKLSFHNVPGRLPLLVCLDLSLAMATSFEGKNISEHATRASKGDCYRKFSRSNLNQPYLSPTDLFRARSTAQPTYLTDGCLRPGKISHS